MGTTLKTAIKNIEKVANKANRDLIKKTYDLMMQLNQLSPTTISNNLKAYVNYANFLGGVTIIEVSESETILQYLNTKLKSVESDPDRRSLRT